MGLKQSLLTLFLIAMSFVALADVAPPNPKTSQIDQIFERLQRGIVRRKKLMANLSVRALVLKEQQRKSKKAVKTVSAAPIPFPPKLEETVVVPVEPVAVPKKQKIEIVMMGEPEKAPVRELSSTNPPPPSTQSNSTSASEVSAKNPGGAGAVRIEKARMKRSDPQKKTEFSVSLGKQDPNSGGPGGPTSQTAQAPGAGAVGGGMTFGFGGAFQGAQGGQDPSKGSDAASEKEETASKDKESGEEDSKMPQPQEIEEVQLEFVGKPYEQEPIQEIVVSSRARVPGFRASNPKAAQTSPVNLPPPSDMGAHLGNQ